MTTIKLNLHELLTEAIGGNTAYVPATIDVDEILEFSDIDEVETDLTTLLHQQQLIAHIWSIEDVQSVRPDLSADQAWEVLLAVEKSLDCTRGITWDTIEMAATMFGKPHEHRPKRFEQALQSYNGLELADLLTDALHWCQQNGHDFETVLLAAQHYFSREAGDDQ